MMSSDRELEELRKRRMMELRRELAEEQRRAVDQQQLEMQKERALRVILTPQARQRLKRIKMVRREFAEELELILIQSAQTGKINIPLNDEQLKRILSQLQSSRRDIKIKRL